MATRTDLMGAGFAAGQAQLISTHPNSFTATPGITTQASATSLGDAFPKIALLTVASSTGTAFTLPANPALGMFVYATNLFASLATASVFAATGNFLAGTTNTAVTLTTGQSAIFFTVQTGTAAAVAWYYNKSA